MAAQLSSELRDLLALTLVPGLGPRLTEALLRQFGSASTARAARAEQLATIPRISPRLAEEFADALRKADVDGELALLEKHNVELLPRHDPNFPRLLGEIPDAPHLLYVRGGLVPADGNAVAVVGSRQCSSYGKRLTEQIAGGLARAGFTVVSGLARGIDGIAHRAALDAGGRTIAVLAGGLSEIYPPEHAELAESVTRAGALLSEAPMGMAPQRGMFHSRNRLISGLARAVVIVEANEKSGALITAAHAAEQGRDVIAVPANVDSSYSGGSLRLLRDGARLIRGIDDLLEDLLGAPAPQIASPETATAATDRPRAAAPKPAPIQPVGLDGDQQRVWDFLAEPRHADEISRELGIPIGPLSTVLMTLEMKRYIRRLAGNMYERRA
jgi:DNA processing protein